MCTNTHIIHLQEACLRYTNSMRLLYQLGLFLMFVFVAPQAVDAAHIFLDIESVSQNRLDTFYVPIRINVDNECVNTVKVAVAYNPDEISVRDVSIGDSILTLWTQKPTVLHHDGVEVGRVTFEGGIPGG